jgi:hypothetical protein
MGGATHVFVVNQVGDHEPGIWPTGYTKFSDALNAVRQYIAEAGYGDEIEEHDEDHANNREGVAVAHIRQGTLGHIHIRKVVY